MPIEVASPIDGIDDTDPSLFEEEGDGTEYNMRELMDQVYTLRDCIMTVPTEQVAILKSGLIARKAKDNTKLVKNNISTPADVLSFLVTPAKKNGAELEGYSDVRVKLGPKKSVKVLEIRIPSDEF
jgi:pyruvate dehydrogenase complex dehydrogenase (E1) component